MDPSVAAAFEIPRPTDGRTRVARCRPRAIAPRRMSLNRKMKGSRFEYRRGPLGADGGKREAHPGHAVAARRIAPGESTFHLVDDARRIAAGVAIPTADAAQLLSPRSLRRFIDIAIRLAAGHDLQRATRMLQRRLSACPRGHSLRAQRSAVNSQLSIGSLACAHRYLQAFSPGPIR